MTTRISPLNKAPSWADLWTSGVLGGGRFYGAQFKLRANNG
jgi:hypothetical protein